MTKFSLIPAKKGQLLGFAAPDHVFFFMYCPDKPCATNLYISQNCVIKQMRQLELCAPYWNKD